MINVRCLCQKHLCGEHVEAHMLAGSVIKGIRLNGYAENNLLELKSLYARHQELSKEMLRRGYNHQSELPDQNIFIQALMRYEESIQDAQVNIRLAAGDLFTRCLKCNERTVIL